MMRRIFAALFVTGSDAAGSVASGTPAIEDEIKKTLAMLAAARAAIYPVDARGTSVDAQYTAENNPAVISTAGEAIRREDMDRDSDQLQAQILAEQSGGKAFANSNGLSDVIDKITSTSSHFYTLAYSPSNPKMDGTFRNIKVKVEGGDYKLSYRRGYFAVEEALPGSSIAVRNQEIQKLALLYPQGELNFEQVEAARCIIGRFLFAHHRFAEQVDSEANTLFALFAQGAHDIVRIFPGDELARHA